MIVAQGTITISAMVVIGDSTRPYATGLLSNSTSAAAISFTGSSSVVYGSVQAYKGGVSISSTNASLTCGIIGKTVSLSSASGTNNLNVSVPSNCAG
jgi:hypothetical protein